jgi:HAMP domain-containing protein
MMILAGNQGKISAYVLDAIYSDGWRGGIFHCRLRRPRGVRRIAGWVIYNNQLEAFREIKETPSSPIVVTEEANELLSELATAYSTALPLAALVAAFGVWWITRKGLRPLQDVADAAEQIHSKALHHRLPQPPGQDEVGRLWSGCLMVRLIG